MISCVSQTKSHRYFCFNAVSSASIRIILIYLCHTVTYVNCESYGGSCSWEHVGLVAVDLEPCGLETVVLLLRVSGLGTTVGVWLGPVPGR